jgi:hypothetical protein
MNWTDMLIMTEGMKTSSIITELKDLLKKAGLPELGPGPRAGVLPQTELSRALDDLLKDGNLPEQTGELIRGLVLLWHDQMEAAHEIAQAIETADGSFLHGILHRREPDYGNATYWFRRVGRHEYFPEIARRTGELLKTKNEPAMEKQLIRNGEWDPYGFIGLCEKAAANGSEVAVVMSVRQVHGIETEVLLEHWLSDRKPD